MAQMLMSAVRYFVWDYFTSLFSTKMAKGICIICKAKSYLNQHTLKTLYYCFVFPYINYCVTWYGVIQMHLN